MKLSTFDQRKIKKQNKRLLHKHVITSIVTQMPGRSTIFPFAINKLQKKNITPGSISSIKMHIHCTYRISSNVGKLKELSMEEHMNRN